MCLDIFKIKVFNNLWGVFYNREGITFICSMVLTIMFKL